MSAACRFEALTIKAITNVQEIQKSLFGNQLAQQLGAGFYKFVRFYIIRCGD